MSGEALHGIVGRLMDEDSSGDNEQYVRALEQAIAFLEQLAGFTTYDEAIAEADGDPDREMTIREAFMTGLDDDWSDIVLQAREITGGKK